ncbi:MAG: hybrid sensor histidine kinase/response regulator [Nitrospirae bacterium]|uniref:hybrid sensor histidine kinase/response regulator n=1 Tax=Candidatus Magnetobacterium casense TaxID=1455061 RepID=UPI000696377E|nr:hybrid sensor histidine kinase/response regulator [Candidatus Magnetobacterium casensis]MBF0338779.1 hybrid sensor histidine kinase/response regulator [Nitrospirota bacterium]
MADRQRNKIIVVEDSITQREMLRRFLEGEGFAVLTAKNGIEGLEAIKKHGPEIVISDVAMPLKDGYEMCRDIKNNNDLSETPVILLTQFSATEDIIRGLDCGADNFIVKPYDEKQLLNSIQFLLATRAISKNDMLDIGIDLHLSGKSYTITSSRRQILNVLISTYESAVHQNQILMKTQAELNDKTSQLEELNRRLEERVAREIDKRIEHEYILLQQSKLAAMGEMMGMIAHQWRQPLNGLSLILQDMKDASDFDELNKAYVDKSLTDAMEQVEFMVKTTDDFREFYRPSKLKENFDILGTVRDVLSIIQFQLKNQAIKFRVQCTCSQETVTVENDLAIPSCSHGLMKVYGYPNELKHVFMNIINNAKDAIVSRKQGNTPGCPTDGLISILISTEYDSIVVRISDNGGGIEETVMDKIFEPYYTTKDQAGTGIGLYISKLIVVKNMRGRLYAENNEIGATFTMELPREKKFL